MLKDIFQFLDKVERWGGRTSDISAILLVGSYARGEAGPDSDIDLVIVAKEPQNYSLNRCWAGEFGAPASSLLEDWAGCNQFASGMKRAWKLSLDLLQKNGFLPH